MNGPDASPSRGESPTRVADGGVTPTILQVQSSSAVKGEQHRRLQKDHNSLEKLDGKL